jgi:hypothetical protein
VAAFDFAAELWLMPAAAPVSAQVAASDTAASLLLPFIGLSFSGDRAAGRRPAPEQDRSGG